MTDEQIIELYWNRDQSAVAQTQQKYEKYLTAIAYNILHDAEDSMESVNDTYMGAWRAIPPHRPEKLSAFLAKITRRVSIDMLRRRTRSKRIPSEYTCSMEELEECLSDGSDTEQQIEVGLLKAAINRYLRSISEEARNIFIGRYFYMDSIRDIAGYCNAGESAVKVSLHRTRKGLKEYLEKEGFYL